MVSIPPRRLVLYMVLLLAGAVVVFVFLKYDPTHSRFFPKCPVYAITGLQCPGCGSQRAIHHLLGGDIAAAWTMNPLLVVSIPYIVGGVAAQALQERSRAAMWARTRLYGVTAVWIVSATIVCFTVLRNIL